MNRSLFQEVFQPAALTAVQHCCGGNNKCTGFSLAKQSRVYAMNRRGHGPLVRVHTIVASCSSHAQAKMQACPITKAKPARRMQAGSMFMRSTRLNIGRRSSE